MAGADEAKANGPGGLRKRAMVYLWRAQQSGAIINIMLLGTLTAATMYSNYIREWTNNYWVLGDSVLGGLAVTMVLIFLGVFGIGFAFDRLKFWREQNIVAIERNPYGSYKLTAKEIHWIRLWMSATQAGNPSEAQKRTLSDFDQWVARSLAEDELLRREVEAVERWIRAGDESVKKLVEDEM
jgi:hypothetical protein